MHYLDILCLACIYYVYTCSFDSRRKAMDVLIKKWGNSHGIRIPKEYLDSLGITPETPLSIEISGNTIVICKKRSHKTLEERVAESGVPLRFSNEINWGKPQGSEVW
jgi:antitoxin MazE